MTAFAPMKAVLVDHPFSDPGWIFERKLDGVRCGAIRSQGRGRARVAHREKMDATYPEIVEALSSRRSRRDRDGEIVAFNGGQTSFERLQGRIGSMTPSSRARPASRSTCTCSTCSSSTARTFASAAAAQPKATAARRRDFGGPLRISAHRVGDGEAYLRARVQARAGRGWSPSAPTAPTGGRRSRDWLKLKCGHEQELVDRRLDRPARAAATGFGALLVGLLGRRTGCATRARSAPASTTARSSESATSSSAASARPAVRRAGPRARAHWVKPELVAQIAFTEWTRDGKLRHPRYLGLRDDKPAREVVRERPS